ncbi:hypothetical protein DSO57_1016416 [Entomophthora muscae]|uniref:Uncharacterized protein n=1 Tax=Entomophthora muscae TaxID=34485 RepID=A0ACC2TSH7_9FUNG|nr:hypothetical protein DSO57_1016416 [Entomophthora muscae]
MINKLKIWYIHGDKLYPQAIKSKAVLSKCADQQVKFASVTKEFLTYYTREGHLTHLKGIYSDTKIGANFNMKISQFWGVLTLELGALYYLAQFFQKFDIGFLNGVILDDKVYLTNPRQKPLSKPATKVSYTRITRNTDVTYTSTVYPVVTWPRTLDPRVATSCPRVFDTSYQPLVTTEEPSAPVTYPTIDGATTSKSDPTF